MSTEEITLSRWNLFEDGKTATVGLPIVKRESVHPVKCPIRRLDEVARWKRRYVCFAVALDRGDDLRGGRRNKGTEKNDSLLFHSLSTDR